MEDGKTEEAGGFDAKANAKKEPKDAAGKAIGYEDVATRKREDQAQSDPEPRSVRP
jgi:hypothetical protein